MMMVALLILLLPLCLAGLNLPRALGLYDYDLSALPLPLKAV